MNETTEINTADESLHLARLGDHDAHSLVEAPTVVIIGPPWPRSGAAWVIKNQIDYYCARGFNTVLVIVPFHRWFMGTNPVWQEVIEGFQEMGARGLFVAPLEERRYKAAKYTTSIFHAFRGTILDWEFATAKSAEAPEGIGRFFHYAPPALFHVNYVQALGFATRLRRKLAGWRSRIPIILETHDIQSQLLQERCELNPWTRKPDQFKRMIRSEISLLKKADVLVHLSVDDHRFFQIQLPGKPHILAMPAIDEVFTAAVKTAPPFKDAIDILFVGQNHAPNLAALQWFFAEVWPLLAEKKYNLKIVGPVDLLVKEKLPQLYESFHSCFVGRVADLARYYSSARCVIAPMISGSGTSIKTIEALALGKPFIGTSKAFRGMPFARINAAGIRSHDSPRDFADAVVMVLADEGRFAVQSRHVYEQIFSIQANFASRDEAVAAARCAKRTKPGTNPLPAS